MYCLNDCQRITTFFEPRKWTFPCSLLKTFNTERRWKPEQSWLKPFRLMPLCISCIGQSKFFLGLHHQSVTAWAYHMGIPYLWSFKGISSLRVTHQGGLFCSCYWPYSCCLHKAQESVLCRHDPTSLSITKNCTWPQCLPGLWRRGVGFHPCWLISKGCYLRLLLYH